jgi:hypothetical protein
VLLAIIPQGPAIAGVDLANTITNILPTLGATSLADLDWCTQAELFQWADEAAKRLSHRIGVFVARDTSTKLTAGTAVYPTPTGHVDTIHVTVVPTTKLLPSSVQELASLDSTWPATSGPATRYSMDGGGNGTILVYAIPTAAGVLAVIMHEYLPQIQAGASAIPVCSPVADYFGYTMLAGARRKESDHTMADMADHFDQRVEMYEKVLTHYFGEGQ